MMRLQIFENKISLAQAAAQQAAAAIRRALAERGQARIVAATGVSQFEFLAALTTAPGINWENVELFHLDEYVSLPITHAASFRKFLLDRLVSKVGIRKLHFCAIMRTRLCTWTKVPSVLSNKLRRDQRTFY